MINNVYSDNTHFESFVPLFDGGLVVSRVRLEEVHVLLAELVLAPEAAHFVASGINCNKQQSHTNALLYLSTLCELFRSDIS